MKPIWLRKAVSAGAFLNNLSFWAAANCYSQSLSYGAEADTTVPSADKSALSASEGNRGVPNHFKYIFSIRWPSIN
jgi:hypothetical protein